MKKATAVILTIILTFSSLPALVFAANDVTYFVGDNITVTIDSDSKVLTVSGTGPMPDYSSYTSAPWNSSPYAETINIEDGITAVGNRCFSNNNYTKTVVIGDSVERIGTYAFSNNKNLKNLETPGEIKRIEDYAFYNCGMTEVFLPSQLEYIGSSAFEGCTNLMTFEFPDSLQYLDASAFLSTKFYRSLPNGMNEYCGFTMQYKGSTIPSTVDIPENVRVISANTLINSTTLTEVNIPYGVEKILDYAFYNNPSMTSIEIPDTVSEIGLFAIGYEKDSSFYIPVAISNFMISGHGGKEAENYANYCGFSFVCNCPEDEDSMIILSHPDCLTGGDVIFGCSYCGKPLRTVNIPPLEAHTFSEHVSVEATCTTDGYTADICSLCGYTLKTEYIEATGHTPDYTSPVIIDATCTEKGELYYKCTACGERCAETFIIAPKGHTAGEMTTLVEPTCTEEGICSSVCTVCGETIMTETIPPTGHSVNGEWTILIQPSLVNETEGFRVKQCAVCGIATEYEYFLAGDLNGDGKINAKDITAIKRGIAGTIPEGITYENGDVNGDGKINAKDITAVKRYISGQ